MLNFQYLANDIIEGYALTEGESLAILNCPDNAILPLLHSAYSIRKLYYGNKVKLTMIINTKACSENYGYCAQFRVSTNPI